MTCDNKNCDNYAVYYHRGLDIIVCEECYNKFTTVYGKSKKKMNPNFTLID